MDKKDNKSYAKYNDQTPITKLLLHLNLAIL